MLNRFRVMNLSKESRPWQVKGVSTTTITYPPNLANSASTQQNGNMHGYRESLTVVKYIQDRYPSARGIFGYTANPCRITELRQRDSAIGFYNQSPIAYSGEPGSLQMNQKSVWSGIFYTAGPNLSSSVTGYTQDDIDNWKTEIFTKLKAEAGNADAMGIVTLAEFGKTMSLITGAYKRWSSMLGKAISSDVASIERFLRRNPKANFQHLKARGKDLIALLGSQTWADTPENKKKKFRKYLRSAEGKLALYLNGHMEYRYGWKTLAYEIEDLFEAAGNVLKPKLTTDERHRRSMKKMGNQTQSVTIVPQTYQPATVVTYDLNWRIDIAAGAIVRHEVPKQLKQLHAYGLLNPLSAIKELIPLEFVSEWFANHGDLLAAAENARFNTFYDAWVSSRVTVTSKPVNASSGSLLEAQESIYSVYQRDANPSTGLVYYSDPMNRARWTDVAAIVFSKISKVARLANLRI